jgi:hypothetical protein
MSGDTKLKPLMIDNGIDRNITAYQAQGKWINGDKIRFSQGYLEKLGGWQKLASNNTAYRGIARRAITWNALNGDLYYALGSAKGTFVYSGGQYYEVTPARAVVTETSAINILLTNTSIVKVSDAGHAAVSGDYVVLTSVSDAGIELSGLFQITSANANNYTIKLNSGSSVTSGAALTKKAGPVTISYLITEGNESNSPATGYGAGAYGSGVYGIGAATGTLTNNIRLWSFDTWGEDLMGCYRGGPIYRWDKSDGITSRMSVAHANIPTANNIVLITEEARHMMVLGTSAFGGDFDPLAVRWSQFEDYSVWSPAVTNAAGGFRINSGSYIVGAVKSKKEIVAFTNEGAHSISYKGAPFFFTQERLGLACGLIGPNAAVDVNGVVYWMSDSGFFKYDGSISGLPCSLFKSVFEPDSSFSVNYNQKEKTYAGVNSEFNEVWWFYPSLNSNENDRYIVYNYDSGTWYDGTLDRTTWVDSNNFPRPLATSTSAVAYNHELTHDADGQNLAGYIESGYFDIEDGQYLTFIDRLIPDNTELTGNYMTATINVKKFPYSTAVTKGPYTVGPTTNKISLRARGRQMSIRFDISGVNSNFRLGRWRMGIAPDGER